MYPATETEVRGVKAAAEPALKAMGVVAIGIGLPNTREPSAHLFVVLKDANASRDFDRSIATLPDVRIKKLLRSVPVQTQIKPAPRA